jgi:hypothetical protein
MFRVQWHASCKPATFDDFCVCSTLSCGPPSCCQASALLLHTSHRASMHCTSDAERSSGGSWGHSGPPTRLYSLSTDLSLGARTQRSSGSGLTNCSLPGSPYSTLQPAGRAQAPLAGLGWVGGMHGGKAAAGDVARELQGSVCPGCASCSTSSGGAGLPGGPGGFQLFNDVTIGFRERHSYAQQELQTEPQPAAQQEAAGDAPGASREQQPCAHLAEVSPS